MQLAQIQYSFGYVKVPLIELNGQYVAAVRHDILVTKELLRPAEPGKTVTADDHAMALPVLAVRFKHAGSIKTVRAWLDRLENNLGPKWYYKDGD